LTQVPMFMTHQPQIRTQNSIPCVDIIVAGVGGTGAYVVRDLARFIYSLQSKGHSLRIKLHLFDPDIVEEKNLNRQNYIPRDLGQYKAQVTAKRYGTAFGVDVQAYTEKLTRQKLRELRPAGTTIVIGCIDNNAGRREIHEWMTRDQSNVYWIDSGNERASGQVICGFGPTITGYAEEDIDELES